MKEIIAVDVDDVSLDFVPSFLKFYNNKYGTDFTKREVTNYNLAKVFGITSEKLFKLLSEFHESEYFDGIEPVDMAREALSILSRERKNVFVTSRSEEIKSKTDLSLKRHFKESYSGIFYSGRFNGLGKTKAEICKEIGASRLIEDCLSYAIDCSENGIPVLLFDQPWNQNGNLSNTLITRIKGGWAEVLGRITNPN
jgi:uncharacterized protein